MSCCVEAILDFSGWVVGWVAGNVENITNSAQLGLELGLSLAIIYRYIKKVDKSCPPYLTARCASSLGYLFIELLHNLPSLSDKENRARQVEYKYKSSIASIV